MENETVLLKTPASVLDLSLFLVNTIGHQQKEILQQQQLHPKVAAIEPLAPWHHNQLDPLAFSIADECVIDPSGKPEELTDDLTRIIYTALMPLVCLLGSVGASISLFIFTRKQMRSSLNTYLAALSFFDLILLFMSILIYPSMSLCLQEVCHFFWNSSLVTYPISLMAQMASVWIAVAITIDRFLAIRYPLHMRAWCTPTRAKSIIFFTVVVAVLYKMPSFFELTLDECKRLRTTGRRLFAHYRQYKLRYLCELLPELRKHPLYIIIYNTYGYLLLLLVIPFIIIIILNIFMILAVRNANSQRQHMRIMRKRSVSGSVNQRKQSRQVPSSNNGSRSGTNLGSPSLQSNQQISAEIDSRCTKMAMITITAFLIFNSLAGMNNVIEAFELSVPFETYRIPIGNLLVCLNSASNILIYSIFGRRFRKMCATLLCPCPCWAYNWEGKNFDSLLRTHTTNV